MTASIPPSGASIKVFLDRYKGVHTPDWETPSDLTRMGVEAMARQQREDTSSELGLAAEEAKASFAAAVRSIGEQMVNAGWIVPAPPRRHGWYPHKPARRPAAARVRQVGA